MLADNSSYLRAAARSKREATRRRAFTALAKLEADGTRVTVTALAKAARFSELRIPPRPCGFRVLCVWQAEVDGRT